MYKEEKTIEKVREKICDCPTQNGLFRSKKIFLGHHANISYNCKRLWELERSSHKNTIQNNVNFNFFKSWKNKPVSCKKKHYKSKE